MAMICEKCGGIIPDVSHNKSRDFTDPCKNHSKGEINIPFKDRFVPLGLGEQNG